MGRQHPVHPDLKWDFAAGGTVARTDCVLAGGSGSVCTGGDAGAADAGADLGFGGGPAGSVAHAGGVAHAGSAVSAAGIAGAGAGIVEAGAAGTAGAGAGAACRSAAADRIAVDKGVDPPGTAAGTGTVALRTPS